MAAETGQVRRFLDFQLNAAQRQLMHADDRVELSRKELDLLICLVAAEGDVITKDELINAVWPGQIVTDAALNKLINRLRLSLANCTDTILIETVRGVGLRFVPSVAVTDHGQLARPESRPRPRWLIPGALAVLISMLVIWQLISQRSGVPLIEDVFSEPLSVGVVMDTSPGDEDLLVDGLSLHLKQLLFGDSGLRITLPALEASQQLEPGRLQTMMTEAQNQDYSLLISMDTASAAPAVNLDLRDAAGNSQVTRLSAGSNAELTQMISVWLTRQTTGRAVTSTTAIERDNQAMTHYLKGLAYLRSDRLTEAVQAFDKALGISDELHSASLKLAEARLKQGHHEQALAAIETLALGQPLSDVLLMQRDILKAEILIGHGRMDEAEALVRQVESFAVEQSHPELMKQVLSTKALASLQLGELTAAIGYRERELEMTESLLFDPNEVGRISVKLARLFRDTGQFMNARDMLDRAATLYTASANISGIVDSAAIQIRMLNDLAEFDAAHRIVSKSERFLAQVEKSEVRLSFLIGTSRLYTETGQHQKAEDWINQMSELAESTDLSTHQAQVLLERSYLGLVRGEYDSSLAYLDQLNELLSGQEENFYNMASVGFLFEIYMHFKRGDLAAFEQRFDEFAVHFPGYESDLEELMYRIRGMWFALQGNYSESEKLLQQEITSSLLSGWKNWAIYTCHDLLDVQRMNDYRNYEQTLSQLEEIRVVDYPYLKYAAEYQAHLKHYAEAARMMTELKLKSNDFWTIEDQMQLDDYQQKARARAGAESI